MDMYTCVRLSAPPSSCSPLWGAPSLASSDHPASPACERRAAPYLVASPHQSEKASDMQTRCILLHALGNNSKSWILRKIREASFSSMIRKKHGIERLNKTWSVINKQISNRIWTIGYNASAADRYLLFLTARLRPELCHPSTDGIAKFNWIAKNDHST